MGSFDRIQTQLGADAESLLSFTCKGIPKERIRIPAADHVSESFGGSDRNAQVMVNLERIHSHGRLGGSGYLSILPVDQGIEHSAAASFAP
ncbi:MAG: fructose-bisphosphate aldolase, partial [Thermoanaerobaculia bacterium]